MTRRHTSPLRKTSAKVGCRKVPERDSTAESKFLAVLLFLAQPAAKIDDGPMGFASFAGHIAAEAAR